MEDLFAKATRDKVKFVTVKGEISIEDLWDLPLTSEKGFDLDSIAKKIAKELKDSTEESFVVESTKGSSLLELKLEILKYIIKVKMEENKARKNLAEKKAKKEKLMEILAKKEDASLEALTPEEIRKQLEEL